MFKITSFLFVTTLLTIPVVGDLTPELVADKMSVGDAQTILSYIACIEFLAVTVMFSFWRRDVIADRKADKLASDSLANLLSNNSVALSDNAQANHRVAKSLDSFERTVNEFKNSLDENTKVIRKCEK